MTSAPSIRLLGLCLAVAMPSVAGVGCGPANRLEGSIAVAYPLDFDEVRIRKQGDFLLIEYVKEATRGVEKLCKLVVDLAPYPARGGLVLRNDHFLESVHVQRVALTGGDFPPVEEGSISFDRLGFRDGGRAEGSFEVIFEGGRDLSGSFSGRIEEVTGDTDATR